MSAAKSLIFPRRTKLAKKPATEQEQTKGGSRPGEILIVKGKGDMAKLVDATVVWALVWKPTILSENFQIQRKPGIQKNRQSWANSCFPKAITKERIGVFVPFVLMEVDKKEWLQPVPLIS